MGDECTCEKCQACPLVETESGARTVTSAEAQADGSRRAELSLHLVVTDSGISLRQQSYKI